MQPSETTGAARTGAPMVDEWGDAELEAAWRRWHPQFATLTAPLTELIIRAAGIAPGMAVLDLASGSGEPALALARAVGPQGRVIATDISAGMVDFIAEQAAARGLTNVVARIADATALPFADSSFDALTCRHGIQHIPDAPGALREAMRVLRPGGRAAFLVWGPPAGQGMFAHMAILARHAGMQPPPSDAPSPFRYAQPGTLAAAMAAAGFQEVREETHRVVLSWPGTPEESWQHTREIAPPVRHLLARLPPATATRVTEEVLAALREHYDGKWVNKPAVVHVAIGTR